MIPHPLSQSANDPAVTTGYVEGRVLPMEAFDVDWVFRRKFLLFCVDVCVLNAPRFRPAVAAPSLYSDDDVDGCGVESLPLS